MLNYSSYICEIAPPSKRGPLASIAQLFTTFGICAGYFICYGTSRISSSLSWRLPLALHSGIALFLAVSALMILPQSPRWLAYKGRREEASTLWDKLGVSDAEREKDLLQNSEAPVLQPLAVTKAAQVRFLERIRGNIHSSTIVFKKGNRRQMLLGVFVMSMQQLVGIDGVLYVCFQTETYSNVELDRYLTDTSSTHPYYFNKPA